MTLVINFLFILKIKIILNHITNHYILLAMTNTDAVSLSKDGDIIEVPDQVEKNYEGLSIILQYFEKKNMEINFLTP